MCRKLVLLLIVFAVVAGFSGIASAALIQIPVNRSGGASGNRDPIGVYDGERDPEPTQQGHWRVGNYMFSDRTVTWASVAPQLENAEQVRTYNSDKGASGVTYTVTFPIGATALVAVDDRFGNQQTYVNNVVSRFAAAGTFTDTGWNVVNSEPQTLSLFSAVLNPGTYVFGAGQNDNNFYVIGALPPPALPTKAYNPAPHNTTIDAVSVALTWSPGASAAFHDVYCGTSLDAVTAANSSDPNGADEVYKARQSGTKYPPGGVLIKMPVTRGKTYYWRIDEVNDVNTWRGDIWSFDVKSSLNYDPSPPDQARFVLVTTDLRWSKGALALSGHIIYLSTDFDDVNDAVPGTEESSPAWLGTIDVQPNPSIEIPGDLDPNKTYYWRADAVEKIPPTTPGNTHKGAVWQFQTVPDIDITDPTLIGWWTFDEGEGGTAFDWSGHENPSAASLRSAATKKVIEMNL